MVNLPDYWLPRPVFELSDGVLHLFETIFHDIISSDRTIWVESELPVPKWVFLCWLSDHQHLVLHGSGNPNINLFEPRTPVDNSPDDFSKQTAVFAASDGISPIFYAIIDRVHIRLHMMTAALYFEQGDGKLTPMHYCFSVNHEALRQQPWREGIVYILPKDNFMQQEPYKLGQRNVVEPHWASLEALQPLAKMRVSSADFPFLDKVRGHDEAYIRSQAASDPYGYPWLED